MSGTSSKLITRARMLRQNQTVHEAILWTNVRNRQLAGFKIRRQVPLGRWCVDFACVEAMVVIEIDGGVHLHPEVMARDAIRDEELGALGFKVLRFGNDAIEKDLGSVLIRIEQVLKRAVAISPLHRKAGERGRG